MKKLYIPISTFNFNNILSSESISPKAFYGLRGFGYSRWLSIPENNIDNVVLLYDKPYKFSRTISDIEDHPMLVEIITDESFPQINEGVFYSDHTIYLSPYRTKFIFFSEQVKRIVMSLSDSSLETKMMRVYGKRFVVEVPNNQNIPHVSLNVKLNESEIRKDFQINKMKGLLYGYYIGALLSVSSESMKKNNLLQELQDIFYSVLSSEEKKLTSLQNERLSILLTSINKSNPAIFYLQSQLANPDAIESVVNQLTKFNVVFPGIISKGAIINSLMYSKGENNQAIVWLEKEFRLLEQQIYQERKLLSVSEEEIVVGDCCLSKISQKVVSNSKDNELTISWVNDVLSSKNYNSNISSFKEILSDEITKKAKSLFLEEWENSYVKQTLNQIRKYVRGQESSFQWNNGIYSSIAAVLSKGNNWTDLLAFMKRKGMTDYRLAFAFYGELNGFANLTRDFTDNLLNINEWKYLDEVYKEIYGQLLGNDPYYSENNLINQSISLTETNCNEFSGYKILDSKVSPIDVKTELLNFASKSIKGSDKKVLINSLKLHIEHYDSKVEYKVIIKDLLNDTSWKKQDGTPKKAWEIIQKQFAPDLHIGNFHSKKKKKPLIKVVGDLFKREAKHFYNDNDAWLVIKDIIPIESRDRIKNDLDWFQKEFCKPCNERYEYYKDIDASNDSLVIEKFCKLKLKTALYFTKELREQCKSLLMEYYGYK